MCEPVCTTLAFHKWQLVLPQALKKSHLAFLRDSQSGLPAALAVRQGRSVRSQGFDSPGSCDSFFPAKILLPSFVILLYFFSLLLFHGLTQEHDFLFHSFWKGVEIRNYNCCLSFCARMFQSCFTFAHFLVSRLFVRRRQSTTRATRAAPRSRGHRCPSPPWALPDSVPVLRQTVCTPACARGRSARVPPPWARVRHGERSNVFIPSPAITAWQFRSGHGEHAAGLIWHGEVCVKTAG